jgi:hypothetical protein
MSPQVQQSLRGPQQREEPRDERWCPHASDTFAGPVVPRSLCDAEPCCTGTALDGTGPSFVGHFHTFDLETIRSLKHGDVIAETDTDHNKVVAKGSDGSRVSLQEHHHFTINANGEYSVEFDKFSASY